MSEFADLDLDHMAGHDYEVTVTNTFAALSPEDAVAQMVEWIASRGAVASYQVRQYNLDATVEEWYIDAGR